MISQMRMNNGAHTTAAAALALKLFWKTPLLQSEPLSRLLGQSVYIKLDALQPSGSFKDRGIGHLCATLREKGTDRLICSSGGNAGLSVATVAKKLGMCVSVIVPESTKQLIIDRLTVLGSNVTVHGKNWNEADELARERVIEDRLAEYVSPFDHPLLWTGHSTIVDEIVEQLANVHEEKIGCIVASVGGGGMISGLFEGCERLQIHPTMIAAETTGAASFGMAFAERKVVRLDCVDSIATSLGALEVTPVALERANRHQSLGGIVKASICSDRDAVEACIQFAEDHRLLVEPACGAALAVVYSKKLRKTMLGDSNGPVVIEVCGGNGVNAQLLHEWKKDFLS